MNQKKSQSQSVARSLRVLITAVVFIFSLSFIGITPVLAEPSDVALSVAPINPGFLVALQAGQGGQPQIADNGHVLGYKPSPWQRPDRNKTTTTTTTMDGAQLDSIMTASSTDPTFDLRPTGVTAVRNQGSSGSCWSFATYASLESFLIFKNGETTDFSENNLKNTHGFDWGPNSGGNADISTAYLARWNGPVLETTDPYSDTSISSAVYPPVKHVQEVTYLPNDIEQIQQAVIDGGATYTAFYYSSTYYNASKYAYYCRTAKSANHAVAIVGWDDNYPKSNFNSTPPANGAFIIKNSWGTSWGQSGYFYLSYYDASMTENVAFHSAETTGNYDNNYDYDPLGATTYFGYGTSTAWGANIFTAEGDETLEAVSFYTPIQSSSYTIKIYTGPEITNPVSGSLKITQSDSMRDAGYHTVDLTSPVALTAGQRYSIVLGLTTPGYTYPMAMEYPIAGYSSAATASAGQSFISSNGIAWTDMVNSYSNTNVCLKAFTSDTVTASKPDLVMTSVSVPATANIGQEITISDTVQNIGSATGTAFFINYYLSTDATDTTGDTLIGSREVPSLGAGSNNSASSRITIPAGTTPANYYVIAVADATDVIEETSEVNNNLASNLINVLPADAKPDLSITEIVAPLKGLLGKTISISRNRQ